MSKWIIVTDKSFSLTKNDLFRPKNINKEDMIVSMSTNTEIERHSMEIQADIFKDSKSMYTQFDINDLYVPDPIELEIIEEEYQDVLDTLFIPIIKTVAGNGIAGYDGDNGLAINAKLNKPYAVIVDSEKNMFVAERSNNIIRRISNKGIITTFAGTGVSGYSGDCHCCKEATFSLPVCLAFDSKENLYIGDGLNYAIRRINKNSDIIETIVGNGKCGISDDGILASLSSIGGTSIAFDQNDNLYIADTKNNCIRMVFNGERNSLIDILIGELSEKDIGKLYTIIGNKTSIYSGDNALANSAGVVQPLDIAIDKMNNIYIVDHINNSIRKVSSLTGIIKRYAGALSLVKNISNVSINKMNNITVQKMSSIDGIVKNSDSNNYSKISGNALNIKLDKPYSITVDDYQNLYISDRNNHVIRKVTNGIMTTIVGNGKKGYSGDNAPAIEATLNEPHRLSLDSENNIYIADSMNNVIRKVIMSE